MEDSSSELNYENHLIQGVKLFSAKEKGIWKLH
nr:MAG TPA: hypothetical protein [Caudoviricetes sp.]